MHSKRTDDDNIIKSLMYLSKEASNSGNDYLSSIIDKTINNVLCESTSQKDGISVSDFISKYQEAPPIVKKQLVHFITFFETNENITNIVN